LVRERNRRKVTEKMKYTWSIDWKYVLLISLVLISVFMTVLGVALDSF